MIPCCYRTETTHLPNPYLFLQPGERGTASIDAPATELATATELLPPRGLHDRLAALEASESSKGRFAGEITLKYVEITHFLTYYLYLLITYLLYMDMEHV